MNDAPTRARELVLQLCTSFRTIVLGIFLHEDRLLVFVGNEILSAWNPQLVAAGRYRLWAIRARFDTKRETHAADAEVWAQWIIVFSQSCGHTDLQGG